MRYRYRPSQLSAVLLASACAAGCKAMNLEPGTQLQSSTFGLKVSPAAPDGTPIVIGSHTTIITTPQPAAAGPNLNRFEGKAGLSGATVKSTVASGPVGDQLNAAGGAAAVLYPPDAPANTAAGAPPSPALPSSPAPKPTQLGEPSADE